MADPTPPEDPEDDDALVAPEADLDDPPEGDDPEPGEDPDPEDEPDGDDPEPPVETTHRDDRPRGRDQPRRGNPEYGRLRRENREMRERLDRVERQPSPDQQALARQREQDELTREQEVQLRGDPAEIARFYRDQSERRFNERVGRLEFHTGDSNDRTEFREFLRENPMFAAVRDEVEERLAMARQGGINPKREALAKIAFADRLMKRAKTSTTRQQNGADRERDRQRGRSTSTRSTTGGGQPSARQRQNENTQAARARRLDESGEL